jgi:hypothetical protein
VILKTVSLWHISNISTLNETSGFIEFILMFIPGIIGISGLWSCCPWLLMLATKPLMNLAYESKKYPSYYAGFLDIQRYSFIKARDWHLTRQNQLVFSALQHKLPPELIYFVIKHITPQIDYTQDNLIIDNGKVMVEMFYFISPEYVVILHKSKHWLVAFSKDVFMNGMFIAGYSSVLYYLWCLN